VKSACGPLVDEGSIPSASTVTQDSVTPETRNNVTETHTEDPPVEQLSAEAVAALLVEVDKPKPRRYVNPFSDAGERLMEWLVNDDNRFMLGLPQVDAMVRGIGRGELCYVIGRPHSGKTQVVLAAIKNNPDKRVVFFTPDENDVLLLTKLIAMTRGINIIDLERKLKARDEAAMRMVREVASETYRNLVVVDRPLTFQQMTDAMKEAREMLGGEIDMVAGDFLELFPGSGDYEGVVQLSQGFKAWLKHENVAGMILHQNSRSGGDRGKAAGMDGMRYGGESEAIYVLEVYRKRDQFDVTKATELDEYERVRDLVTVNVAKNKRPPSQVGECDFRMDPSTGNIMPLSAVEPATGLNQPSVDDEIPFDEEPF